ncbi:TonB-dependent receptor [uncultured Bacteroides sp.]|uniref:TonB-dependent receptor n=1 Tax=uncultured Bacteroides sp. TaxID=162156 RepID=UPI00261DA935|nr:TonB-dependent receptor [uncultured Bacteroides sp.]
MINYISAFLMTFGAFAMTANAQTPKDSALNRTVVVENQYNPEVMDASKINVLPKVEEPAVPKAEINYATSARPMTGWEVVPMELISNEMKQTGAYRGYLRAAYGNLNNADAKLSYLWDITPQDRLGVMGSFYGRYGDIPSFNETPDEWKSRFFKTDVALDYRHQFRKLALTLGGSFASQVFNYMPIADVDSKTAFSGSQHFTWGEGYVGIESVEKEFPVVFALQTGFCGFSRKQAIPYLPDFSEKSIHTLGYVSGALNDQQSVGIGFEMDNLMYDKPYKNFTLLQLNPYYQLKDENLSLRVGAHVDLQKGNDGGIEVAPDVKLDYTFSDTYVFYLHATGGATLNDFRRLNEFSPYAMPVAQLQKSYTQVDAQAGLKGSPMAGMNFKVFGGYQITKDDLFAIPAASVEESAYYYTGVAQEKAKVGYGGVALSYAYKDWFDFAVDGTYYGWSMDEANEYLLALKPQFSVNATLRAKIMDNLHVDAGYRYEGRVDVDGVGKADAVSNLSVSATYEFLNRINVFVRTDNLLNQDYITETGYPVQGLTVMGGISLRF